MKGRNKKFSKFLYWIKLQLIFIKYMIYAAVILRIMGFSIAGISHLVNKDILPEIVGYAGILLVVAGIIYVFYKLTTRHTEANYSAEEKYNIQTAKENNRVKQDGMLSVGQDPDSDGKLSVADEEGNLSIFKKEKK